MLKARLIRDEELAPGTSRVTACREPGVFLMQGCRRGSKTVEGSAYLFAAPMTETDALAWLAAKEIPVSTLEFESGAAVALEAPAEPDTVPPQEMELQEDGTYTLRNLPIFKTGSWEDMHGTKYEATGERLRALADATNEAMDLLRPSLNLGHGGEKGSPVEAFPPGGAPSFGIVERLSFVGDTLLANARGVPAALADAIKRKFYRRQSPEVEPNWRNPKTGEVKSEVMTGLAILGARMPAITTMPDLLALANSDRKTVRLLGMPGELVDEPETGEKQPEPADAARTAMAFSQADPNHDTKEKTMAEEAKVSELQATLERMKGALIDRTLATAVEQRRIAPAQVEGEKALLFSMGTETLEASCAAMLSRPQMPDLTKPVGGAKDEKADPADPLGALKGKAKIMAFASKHVADGKGTYAQGVVIACEQYPDDNALMHDEYGLTPARD